MASFENEYVNKVYDLISEHFSDTRYKPWPIVVEFFNQLTPYSIGSDIGCGNGKNCELAPNIFIIGNDKCEKLVNIAASKKPSTDFFLGDNLSLPIRSHVLDFAISIAVIHHFSTKERRRAAIEEIVRVIKPGGLFLMFVWAYEQQKKGDLIKDDQNVLIPWSLPQKYLLKEKDGEWVENTTDDYRYQRYYHLFKKGELDELVLELKNVKIETSGYDKDNWYIVGRKSSSMASRIAI